jgi:hypothetical protein
MTNFHHKPIHKFDMEGEINDEAAIGRLKNEYIRMLVLKMKLDGYVPDLTLIQTLQ